MAWSAPATYSTGQIMAAVDLNLIRDNLKYLKGQSGGVAIEDMLTVGAATAPSASLHAIRSGSGAQEAIRLDNTTNTGSNGSKITWRNAAQAFDAGLIQAVRNGAGTDFLLQFGATSDFSSTNAPVGMTLSSTGLGIGTAAPQSKLHVSNTSGGMINFSSPGVAGTLVTLAVAGTVTKGAVFWICDINNTTNLTVSTGLLNINVNSLLTYTNNDTMTVAVTAGGAMTIQRTTGTNGTHQINGIALYY